ncbi:hypothetical protein [Beijerinckia mobilis]|uniref:hypothetical protein n=1 Tax=Beijerinckia mobilis TaxID=231434 RepID=UPI0005532EDA|nr:hypothetical protein [Beijerinckia mobilis]
MSWRLRRLEGAKSASFILGKRIDPDEQGYVTVDGEDGRILSAAGWSVISMQVDEPTALDAIKLAKPLTLQKLFRGN